MIVWGQRSPGEEAAEKLAVPGCLGDYQARSVPLDLKEAVTAVDFAPAPCLRDGR